MDRVLKNIGMIYDASIDQEKWPHLIDELASSIGGVGGTFAELDMTDQGRPTFNAVCTKYQPYLQEYFEKYIHHEKDIYQALCYATPHALVHSSQLVKDYEAYKQRPDVAFCKEKLGFVDRYAVRLNNSPGWENFIFFHFETEENNITPEATQIIQMYLPHLSRAGRVSQAFMLLKQRYNAVLAALDKFRLGVFVLDARGFIIEQNKTADEFVALHDGLFIHDSKLMLSQTAVQNQLNTAVEEKCRALSQIINKDSVFMAAHRPSGKTDWLIEISPLSDPLRELDAQVDHCMVTISDIENPPLISLDGIGALYHLSKTELETAQFIIQGYSNSDIADMRNLSVETIKSHVKSLFWKTRAKNRSDLVRICLSINTPVL